MGGDAANGEAALRAGEERLQRAAVGGVEIDAPDQLAREVERLVAEKDSAGVVRILSDRMAPAFVLC